MNIESGLPIQPKYTWEQLRTELHALMHVVPYEKKRVCGIKFAKDATLFHGEVYYEIEQKEERKPSFFEAWFPFALLSVFMGPVVIKKVAYKKLPGDAAMFMPITEHVAALMKLLDAMAVVSTKDNLNALH